MHINPTAIPGCFELVPKVMRDERGYFVKTFHEQIFREQGLTTHFAEEYYTYSHQGVLRGLHFQTPPRELIKLVYCVSGAVFDAVVDLRIGSPAYGKHLTFELSAEKATMLYLPAGLAHGFFAVSPGAVLMYKVTAVYSSSNDSGILWDSAGIPWPGKQPVISQRDREFVALKDFESPFRFNERTPT